MVLADKAYDNIVFICNANHYNCILMELCTFGNLIHTYNFRFKRWNSSKARFSFKHIWYCNQWDEWHELLYLSWFPKLHKNPTEIHCWIYQMLYRTPYFLFTEIFTTVKEKRQTYCETICARDGANQIWILRYSLKNYQ